MFKSAIEAESSVYSEAGAARKLGVILTGTDLQKRRSALGVVIAERDKLEPLPLRSSGTIRCPDTSDWTVQGALLARPAEPLESTEYGTKDAIIAPLTGLNGRMAEIMSVWIILAGEGTPRFVTVYPKDSIMRFHEFDTVVLQVDMPSHGLKTGDIGAVVQVYSKDAVEVEFVTASGRTQALVMLAIASIRPVSSKDILAVRQLDAA